MKTWREKRKAGGDTFETNNVIIIDFKSCSSNVTYNIVSINCWNSV